MISPICETKRSSINSVLEDIVGLARKALKRMYRPEENLFAFTLRRRNGRDGLEGVSRRYSAIALIGLADDSAETAQDVLGQDSTDELCARLCRQVNATEDLGVAALTLWAARRLEHPGAKGALEKLRLMRPAEASYPTVELAWSLQALTLGSAAPTDAVLAEAVAQRLLAACRPCGLFAHFPPGARPSRLGAHVTSFADLVYPIQALSSYSRAARNNRALDVAERCARKMCELQGPQGQWWWHYDVRVGDVLEKYPVYAVHQDAMGPMCLFALAEAGGPSFHTEIARSVRWFEESAPCEPRLVDRESGIIWRKVARREPRKLVRKLQAGASKLHPLLRVPGTDLFFPPGEVDWESRPYHMGWILHAFSAERVSRLLGSQPGEREYTSPPPVRSAG